MTNRLLFNNQIHIGKILGCLECPHQIELTESYLFSIQEKYQANISDLIHRFRCAKCGIKNAYIYSKLQSRPTFNEWSLVRANTPEGVSLDGTILCILCKNYVYQNICKITNQYIQVHPAFCEHFKDARN